MPNTKRSRPVVRVLRASASAIALALATSHLDAQQPATARPRPLMRFGRLAAAVVGTPDIVAAAADSAAVARALGACGLPAAVEGSTRGALPTPADTTRLVVIVVPVPMLPPRCDFAAANAPALLARGIRVAAQARHGARHDPRSATLLVRGRPLPVEPARAFPVTTVAESPESASGTPPGTPPTALALSVPLDLLTPGADGRLPDVHVRLTWADTALPPENLAIWSEHVREAWLHALPARVARAPVNGAAPPVRLPAPTDGALRAAHARWAAGDMREGALLALARLRDASLAREDQRVARLMVATTLLSHGDSAAARLLFADVAADAPCLTMASAPAEWRRLTDAVRPLARCTVMPTRRVALASLLPGLGQALTGRRRSALLLAGATAAFAASTLPLTGLADRTYDRYMDERDPDELRRLHDRATLTRAGAHTMAGLAVATWMLGSLDAVRTEQRHRRELERTRELDARLTVSVAPPVPGSPARAGVVLAW